MRKPTLWLCVTRRHTSLTPDRRQSKTLILSTNVHVDQKSLETEFSIVICRRNADKWQPKTLFLAIFDPRSSIVKSVLDCCLSGVSLRSPHEKSLGKTRTSNTHNLLSYRDYLGF